MTYSHRKDTRTDEQFEKDIKLAHQKEGVFAEAFRIQLEQGSGASVLYEPRGVDSSGKIKKGRVTDDFDCLYKIVLSQSSHLEMSVEIKTCPEYLEKFFTFKVGSLKRCVKHNAALLVVKHKCYYICGPERCQDMIDNFPHKIYYGFSPNDLSVRIDRKTIENYFNKSEWSAPSQQVINKNMDILTR